MSRRHHHHNIQPYDYDRFSQRSQQSKERDIARGIEYQDDSLSSINSDEDSYLHHHVHAASKEKKSNFFSTKTESASKPTKPEKPTSSEPYHQKEAKSQTHPPSNFDQSAVERLGRLETMLEELVKRNNTPPQPPQPAAPSTPIVPEKVIKVVNDPKEGQYCLVPRRTSFTTSMWINKIEEVSLQNNWSEKSTVRYMGTQMSGIVKAWYNSLPNYDFTWPEWKILISKIFPDNTDFVTTLKRLVTRLKQPDESITTYYFSKMYLIEACKITGGDAVSCLIDGLNNQVIQEQAKSQNFLTPETLYSQFLMTLPDYTVDYAPSAPPSTESVLNNWYYQDQEANVQGTTDVEVPTEDLFQYERDPRDEEIDYHKEGNSAFYNKDEESSRLPKRTAPVHSRLDKRFIRPNNFRNYNRIPMAAKVCSICSQRGHLARTCRNVDKILYCKLLNNSQKNCFYKNCTINNQKFVGLIDTGCSTVIIRHQEASKLNLPVSPTSHQMQVYGGGFVPVLGVTEIKLGVDSVEACVRAMIVQDDVQDIPVIVGQSFLKQRNMTMLLENETVKISEAP